MKTVLLKNCPRPGARHEPATKSTWRKTGCRTELCKLNGGWPDHEKLDKTRATGLVPMATPTLRNDTRPGKGLVSVGPDGWAGALDWVWREGHLAGGWWA